MGIELILVLGYLVAGALPIAAFVRLLRRNAVELRRLNDVVAERGHASPTLGDFGALWRANDQGQADIRGEALHARRELAWDIAFVGGGVTLGSLTSILSVLLL